jgi:predicted PurR-regulated permease PerM
VLGFLLLFTAFIITIAVIFVPKINLLIDNTNELVQNKIPYELDNLHKIINENNEKIAKIEQNIVTNLMGISTLVTNTNKFVTSYNKNFNNHEFIGEITSLVGDIRTVLNKQEMISIEKNLETIARALEKIAFNGTKN